MLSEDGFVTARPEFPKRLDGTPVFDPALVAVINWADSGPGFPWPEAYHVTEVPELGIVIVTASRDSEDLMGCTDHAIGWRPISEPAVEVARELVQGYWQSMADETGQEPWETVLNAGIVGPGALETMKMAVWTDRDEDDDEDKDEVDAW